VGRDGCRIASRALGGDHRGPHRPSARLFALAPGPATRCRALALLQAALSAARAEGLPANGTLWTTSECAGLSPAAANDRVRAVMTRPLEAVIGSGPNPGDVVAGFGRWVSDHEPDAIIVAPPTECGRLRARLDAGIRERSRRTRVLPFSVEEGGA